MIWAEFYIYSWWVPSQRSSALLNVHVFKEDAFINKFFCFLVKEKIIFIQIHNKIWLVWHNQAIKGYIYWLPVGLSQVTEIKKKKGAICSFWFRFHFSRFPFGSNLCNRIRILLKMAPKLNGTLVWKYYNCVCNKHWVVYNWPCISMIVHSF